MPSGVSLTRRVVRWRSWVPSWCSSACIWRETLPFGKAKKSAAREKLSSSATLMNNCIAWILSISLTDCCSQRNSNAHIALFIVFLTSNAGFHNVVMPNVAISQQEKGGIAFWERWILKQSVFSAIPFKVYRGRVGYLCLFLSPCRLLFWLVVAEFHF